MPTPTPYMLCIDTTREHCTVMVSVDGHLAGFAASSKPLDHSKSISLLVSQLFSKQQIDFHSITALAVNLGPGSYTSLRTGLSFTLGLRLGIERPLVGFTTLHVLQKLLFDHGLKNQKAILAVALAGEAFFAGSAEGHQRQDDAKYYSSYAQMYHQLNGNSRSIVVIKYPDKVTITGPQLVVSLTLTVYNEALCAVALQRFNTGLSNTNTWTPLYIRPPYITQPKKSLL